MTKRFPKIAFHTSHTLLAFTTGAIVLLALLSGFDAATNPWIHPSRHIIETGIVSLMLLNLVILMVGFLTRPHTSKREPHSMDST